MAHCDDLESNPLFCFLQNKCTNKFQLAQKNSWLICIPCINSLKNIQITEEFAGCHILKPSPFFKSHYISAFGDSGHSLELEETSIKTPGGKVKILFEELGYNEDYKPFKILVIEKPLNAETFYKNDFTNGCKSLTKEIYSPITDCKVYLQTFSQSAHLLKTLDKKIKQFCESYVVLPEYLHDAAEKIKNIIDWAIQAFIESHNLDAVVNENMISSMKISLEKYVLNHLHYKVFPVIKTKFLDCDKKLSKKLFTLYGSCVTPDQLGVKEPFCCQAPDAVVELASLNLNICPIERMICMMKTLEFLNQDIEKFLRESYCPVISRKDIPQVTSDDLIPLLITVMIQARPEYLESNLYYVQNFCWQISLKQKMSFVLVTFQAAKEYLKNFEINVLNAPKNKTEKEISWKKLVEMAVEMEKNTGDKSSNAKKALNSHTGVDIQLGNVTKMIDASTEEFSKCSSTEGKMPVAFECTQNDGANGNSLGDFLSSLQLNGLGFSCGKQM